MWTTVLAYLILFMGFITFLGGAFGALLLIFEEVAKTGRVPFRYYAMMVGLISGGLGMIGRQGLRLLLLIVGKE
jgi:hypothetical protein